VVLRSPCSAEGFYSRLGFLAVGEPLEEAGISHIDMARVPGQR
jgi:predicted GNAT family N-acyltransferase